MPDIHDTSQDNFDIEDFLAGEHEAVQNYIKQLREERVLRYGVEQVDFIDAVLERDWVTARVIYDFFPETIDLLFIDEETGENLLDYAAGTIKAYSFGDINALAIKDLTYLVEKAKESGITMRLDQNFSNPLHQICGSVHHQNIHHLLALFIKIASEDDLNCYNQNGRTPLLEAIEKSDHVFASMLAKDQRVNINIFTIEPVNFPGFSREEYGELANRFARQNGLNNVAELIEHRADFNEKAKYLKPSNDYLKVPLLRMAVQANPATIRCLIRNFGRKIFEWRDGEDWSILHIASYAQNLPVVSLLLDASQVNFLLPQELKFSFEEYKNFINYQSHGTNTAFDRGLINSATKAEVTKMFLRSPHLDPNIMQSFDGSMLLHDIVTSDDEELLFEAAKNPHIDFNLIDQFGNTPLRLACQNGDYKTVEKLALLQRLGKKINPNDVSNKQEIAEFLARFREESWFGESATIHDFSLEELVRLYQYKQPIKVKVTYDKTFLELNIEAEDKLDPALLEEIKQTITYFAEQAENIVNEEVIPTPDWVKVPYNILNIPLDKKIKDQIEPKYYNQAKLSKVFYSNKWFENGNVTLNFAGLGRITISKVDEYIEKVTVDAEITYDHIEHFVKDLDRAKVTMPNIESLFMMVTKKGDFKTFRALLSFDNFNFNPNDSYFEDMLFETGSQLPPKIGHEFKAYYSAEKMRRSNEPSVLQQFLDNSLEHGGWVSLIMQRDQAPNSIHQNIAKSATNLRDELLANPHSKQMQFATLFTQRLAIASLRRINHDHLEQPHSRRLDSLARLLEGNGICGAVCFDGEKILFSANFPKYYDKSEHVKLIDLIQQYLSQYAKDEFLSIDQIKQDRHKLLSKACHLKILPSLKGLDTTNTPKVAKLIDNLIKLFDNNLAEFASLEKEFDDYGALSDNTIKAILARFKYNYEDSVKSIAKPGKEEQAKNNFNMIVTKVLRSVIDIRKLENSISTEAKHRRFGDSLINAFKTKFEIIKEGDSGVHAEMRLVNHIRSQTNYANNKPYYIGISKLCCSHCKLCFDHLQNFSHDYGEPKFGSRGSHGMSYAWPVPEFLKTNEGFAKIFHHDSFLCQAYNDAELEKPGSPQIIMDLIGDLKDPKLPFYPALDITKTQGRMIGANWSQSNPKASTIGRFDARSAAR